MMAAAATSFSAATTLSFQAKSQKPASNSLLSSSLPFGSSVLKTVKRLNARNICMVSAGVSGEKPMVSGIKKVSLAGHDENFLDSLSEAKSVLFIIIDAKSDVKDKIGTSPFEHGEVFALDDGGEVDLDLGNYERFLDKKLTCDNNITTGKIYQSIIDKEKRGDYLGKTVQVVPHITDAIQEWIERVARIPVDGKEGPADDCVIELGGSIGDIESMLFIEAPGPFSFDIGPGNFCCIHGSLVPVLNFVGEQTTQHSFGGLGGLRSTLNILACSSTKYIVRGGRVLFPLLPDAFKRFKQIGVISCSQEIYVLPAFPVLKIDQTSMWMVGGQVGSALAACGLGPVYPSKAGVYIALAQAEILRKKRHPYSEINNEILVKFLRSTNVFIHANGVSFLADNYSTTTRLASMKCTSRFDFVITQQPSAVMHLSLPKPPAMHWLLLGWTLSYVFQHVCKQALALAKEVQQELSKKLLQAVFVSLKTFLSR